MYGVSRPKVVVPIQCCRASARSNETHGETKLQAVNRVNNSVTYSNCPDRIVELRKFTVEKKEEESVFIILAAV